MIAFPLRSGRQGYPLLPFLFSIVLDCPSRAIRQTKQNKIKDSEIGDEEVKLLLDMILFRENNAVNLLKKFRTNA